MLLYSCIKYHLRAFWEILHIVLDDGSGRLIHLVFCRLLKTLLEELVFTFCEFYTTAKDGRTLRNFWNIKYSHLILFWWCSVTVNDRASHSLFLVVFICRRSQSAWLLSGQFSVLILTYSVTFHNVLSYVQELAEESAISVNYVYILCYSTRETFSYSAVYYFALSLHKLFEMFSTVYGLWIASSKWPSHIIY